MRALVRAGRRQDGVSMVEVLMVMVVMAILMAISVPSFLGARNTSYRKSVVTAASAYQTSIMQFRMDHANRVPIIGTTDWPSANVTQGPLDMLGRPYNTSGVPEAVSDGITSVGATAADAQGRNGRIVYVPGAGVPPTTFTIQVDVYENGQWVSICTLGNTAAASEKCS